MQQEGRKEGDSKEKKSETDKGVKMLLEKDNQVRHALQLLKTWDIFSHIKKEL